MAINSRKIILSACMALLVIVLLFAGYVWVTLNWSYSKGERAGYLQKFSQKGWLCKTWEGEMQMIPAPGVLPEKFLFSVREDVVATQLNNSMGKKISVSYEQHKGIPTTCFGESEYYVIGVRPSE
ncbi:MAG: hypothetical protein PHP95_06510 [Desulfuromonadaceae bacterium]|nr:hypothetical protein [Desulfuromonadaceae bacterium]MDD2848093.1 hypothetical protein [Desulfuromonadaceae bacterium]MDD4132066.1 hypothetical protein [Desulfuromonadaceae bacterium]